MDIHDSYRVVTGRGDGERQIGTAKAIGTEIHASLEGEFSLSELKLVRTDTNGLDLPAESLMCTECGNDGPDSLAEAIVEGWRHLEHDDSGLSWNFLGSCPDCLSEDDSSL